MKILRQRKPLAEFLLGLVIGAVSACSTYILFIFSVFLPLALAFTAILVMAKGRKYLGLGLLLSIPIQIYIMVVICGSVWGG
ncbi:hypothetical protein [Bacillus sp. 165]|uniref:hypothetical protein n=1 Tax=Bacillus sp. 165 TaxID=1529117 RepID=UPI001AD98B44|nr:hypothetical protein [Bacillus sp. 165]MBO9130806.1 hypothetical protein [Bacillus sp. 165]